jgi:DNA-binding NtrC family response regulator
MTYPILPPKKRVLVVDDEPAVVSVICDYLEEAGFDTVSAKTAAEARNEIANNSLDGVLLDVKLPDEDGITFLKKIKAERPGLTVIMLTGTGLLQTALMNGASGYINKGTNLDDMVVLVKRLID